MFPCHKSLLQVNLGKKHQILCPGEIRERMGWFAKSNIRAPAVKRYGLGQGCGFDHPTKKIRIRQPRKILIRPETALNVDSLPIGIKSKNISDIKFFYNFGLILF